MSEQRSAGCARRRRRARDARRRPRLPDAGVRRHAAARAAPAAAAAAAAALRADRAGLRRRATSARATAISPASTTGEPLGERIIVSGRVLDSDGRPVPQRADRDLAGQRRRPLPPPRRPAPGAARPQLHRRRAACLTDDDGRYRFVTIKPGAYPWRNHDNAWRPAHIHFSVFGRAFTERLVTQMYFPGDPLFAYDPIFQSVRDPSARERMVARFDLADDDARVGARLPLRRRARRRGATPLENA